MITTTGKYNASCPVCTGTINPSYDSVSYDLGKEPGKMKPILDHLGEIHKLQYRIALEEDKIYIFAKRELVFDMNKLR